MSVESIRALKVAAAKRGKPKKGRIRFRTKKQAKTMKRLSEGYGPYLEKNPVCAIQSPVCTQVATCVNHKKGRGKNEVLDESTHEPSCYLCNDYIESHHAWAVAHGHKVSRHTKNNQ